MCNEWYSLKYTLYRHTQLHHFVLKTQILERVAESTTRIICLELLCSQIGSGKLQRFVSRQLPLEQPILQLLLLHVIWASEQLVRPVSCEVQLGIAMIHYWGYRATHPADADSSRKLCVLLLRVSVSPEISSEVRRALKHRHYGGLRIEIQAS